MDHRRRHNNISYNSGNVLWEQRHRKGYFTSFTKVTVQHLLVLTNTEGTLLTFGLDVLESMRPWIHGFAPEMIKHT